MENLDLISQSLKNLFEEIDQNIANRIIFIDSKKRSSDGKIIFVSEKIIYSLTNIGVPLNYSIHILDMVIEKIMEFPEGSTVETSDIRRLVSTGLYVLHTRNDVTANAQKCQIWGDLYLRKYGNPEGPIKIIHRDGRFDKLRHGIIENSIIPEVFSEITDRNKADILKKFSKKERNEMRDEVMRIVQELGIYKIHNQTLQYLVRDLATQPPHPWVFNIKEPEPFIKYNMDRVFKNLKNAKNYNNALDYPNCRNSIIETVHHVSASILGYYEEFPGCGFLAPFYNLKNLLNKMRLFFRYRADKTYNENSSLIRRADEIREEIDLFGRSKIWEINHDLIINNNSLDVFLEKLESIDHNLKILHRDEIILETINELDNYVEICESLIYKKSSLKDKLSQVVNYNGKDKGSQFEDIMFKVLSLSDDLSIKKGRKIKNKQFDLIIQHKSKKGLFPKIGEFLFVECKNTKAPADVEIIEKLGSRIREKPDEFCNAGLIISSHGFTKGAMDEAYKLFSEGIYLILLDINDIHRLIDNDIIDELNAKFESLFLGVVN
ncbi:MAG: restriction endonuclease [bacterium]|nr:restriction endonuclease [bacterium]